MLREALGVRAESPRPGSVGDFRLGPPRLPVDAVAEIVGAEHVGADEESRIRHTRGRSTLDLLRLRRLESSGAPDLVVMPGSHDEVLALLGHCSERRIAVVPFGGGTSVVGGLEPEAADFEGVIALDLQRMNALVDLDEQSRTAVLEPGLRGPQAEALLGERGYTIGHFPQSFEYASLGGFAATRSSGQASSGYGRFDELVVGLTVATPVGTLTLGRAPRSAAGPDLRQLILGSEGTLGVITSLTVQVRPVPERRVYDGWRFASFTEGLLAVRRVAQAGPLPTVLRLSDEAETALNLARPEELGGGGPLAIAGYEGPGDEVATRRARASLIFEDEGALGEPRAGESWERDRYRLPYLRDALLDAGALVETLETAGFWSALPRLYQGVSSALRDSLITQGTPPIILCHVSHVYPTGASLYFTIGCAQAEDPVSQWRLAKAAASDAIMAGGGTITHHHGVGTDHRDWLAHEVGPLGVGILRAAKAELDPAGILNPGILIPPA